MDSKEFQARSKRLKEVNEVILQLDETIRPAAFGLLAGYVGDQRTTAIPKPTPSAHHKTDPADDEGADPEAFFGRFPDGKPDDNAKVIAAYHYDQYGVAPFHLDEIREIATQAGLTIPKRLDMTFKSSYARGKALFTSSGHGRYVPTVSGETFLKSTYGVKKGKNRKNGDNGA